MAENLSNIMGIPYSKPSFSQLIESPFKTPNILKMLENRQQGLLKTDMFNSALTKLKVQQLKPSGEEFVIDSDISNCKFLRGSDSGCIVGVWTREMDPTSKHSSIYHMKFEYNLQQNCSRRNELCPVVSELSCCGPFFKRIDVTDSCEKTIRGRSSLLYVGNSAVSSGRIVLNFTDDDSQSMNNDDLPEIIWHSCKQIWSCAINAFTEYFAAGADRGCFLFKISGNRVDIIEIEYLPGNVLSVEFNSNGNLLYCGIEDDELQFYDLRESPRQVDEDLSLGTCVGLRSVKEMKLLSDDVSMVATLSDGKMYKMDLRMKKPIFSYPSFCNKINRRPPSVSEALDLLCATGDDNCSRIWSLGSGELVKTIQPYHEKTSCHACLVTDQRRWFVAMVHDNVLTPVFHY